MRICGAFFLLAALLCAQGSAAAGWTGPPPQPTKDLLWPLPAQLTTTPGSAGVSLAVQVSDSLFSLAGGSSGPQLGVLQAGFKRYVDILRQRTSAAAAPSLAKAKGKSPLGSDDYSSVGNVRAVQVFVKDLAAPLQLGADESYKLHVAETGTAQLNSSTVWGALHALEIFVQMVQVSPTYGQYFIADLPVSAAAFPRFSHRGLLIDSARHYLPVQAIMHAIDALAYNHLNVLHWHAVDAESFPVEAPSAAKLSEGAWGPKAVYSLVDIKSVIEYGYQRGVRVILEFDTPGHSDSWGKGYPAITAKCPDWSSNINNVPLNPAVAETWSVLQGLLTDVTGISRDDFFHIGGDEVVYACWKEDQTLTKWMTEQGISAGDYDAVMQYYENRLWKMVSGQNKSMIAWEEVFNLYGLKDLPESLVIEVWKDEQTLLSVANAGRRGILAYGWYLDHLSLSWKDFYQHEPFTSTSWNHENERFIIGGEACAWGEQLDADNFDQRVWPRTSATAERLWSPKSVTDIDSAQLRIINQICRLNARGVGAAPIVPNYCPL